MLTYVFATVSAGADTKTNTQGRGALEIGDIRPLEDNTASAKPPLSPMALPVRLGWVYRGGNERAGTCHQRVLAPERILGRRRT